MNNYSVLLAFSTKSLKNVIFGFRLISNIKHAKCIECELTSPN